MSQEQLTTFDYSQEDAIIPLTPPIFSSDRAGGRNILIKNLLMRDISWKTSEFDNPKHVIVIPTLLFPLNLELTHNSDSKIIKTYCDPQQPIHDCIHIYPTGLYSFGWDRGYKSTQFCLEPSLVAGVAHEKVDGDRVELALKAKTTDLLIYQLCLALNTELETSIKTGNPSDAFYVEALATALAAHLLKHYTTRPQKLQEYADGLPKEKLDRAIDYIHSYLEKNLSLEDMAAELGMSQYYFCHLFKRSMGLSPHQYLIQQRIERAKILLSQSKKTINAIATECGFASQSHLTRYFRRHTGVTPGQFRQK